MQFISGILNNQISFNFLHTWWKVCERYTTWSRWLKNARTNGCLLLLETTEMEIYCCQFGLVWDMSYKPWNWHRKGKIVEKYINHWQTCNAASISMDMYLAIFQWEGELLSGERCGGVEGLFLAVEDRTEDGSWPGGGWNQKSMLYGWPSVTTRFLDMHQLNCWHGCEKSP